MRVQTVFVDTQDNMEKQLPKARPTHKQFLHDVIFIYHVYSRVQKTHIVYHHYREKIKEIRPDKY